MKHFLGGVITMVALMGCLVAAIEGRISNNPPAWFTERHQTSQSLKQQTAPRAQFVALGSRLSGVYIPPEIEVETGGDGIVVRGPTQDIYRFHRKIYGLDSPPRTFVFGWEWKVK